MTYWTADKRLFKKEFDGVGAGVRLFLLVVGVMIGVSLGFYVAVRVFPLPVVTHQYFYKVQ